MKKLFLVLIIFFNFNYAYSLIEVDITRGNLDPLPIAVSPLHVDAQSDNLQDIKVKELGDLISSVIESNFKSTGLFNPLNKDAFVQKPDIAHLPSTATAGPPWWASRRTRTRAPSATTWRTTVRSSPRPSTIHTWRRRDST